MPVMNVSTTVQKFIVVVMLVTHVSTTVHKYIVVVMPGMHKNTTLAKINPSARKDGS